MKRSIMLKVNGDTYYVAVDPWRTLNHVLREGLKLTGTIENALHIQIRTALIAMLLIKYLQFKSNFGRSLSNLTGFVPWNLFASRFLWGWIDHPFNILTVQPKPAQPILFLLSLGQHPYKRTT